MPEPMIATDLPLAAADSPSAAATALCLLATATALSLSAAGRSPARERSPMEYAGAANEYWSSPKVLDGAGRVSKKQADGHAENEYEQFAARRRALLESEGAEVNVRALEDAAKALPKRDKKRK